MKRISLTVMWLSLGVFYTLNDVWPLGVLCFAVALIIAHGIGKDTRRKT